MEHNDASIDGVPPSGQSDANEFSGSGATSIEKEAGFDFAGTPGTSDQSKGIRDRAKNVIGTAGEKLADVGSSVRERAGTAKDKLADALDSGAEKLRERSASGGATLAGATADGSTAVQADSRIAQVSDKVAGGMEATAGWLRDADVESIKSGLEQQVKEHPGRTLLIAAGLGYLIGRAFRNNQ
jgi:ElaB/YqjD/DUF883 family membrane-anchored ribosome-binding protein